MRLLAGTPPQQQQKLSGARQPSRLYEQHHTRTPKPHLPGPSQLQHPVHQLEQLHASLPLPLTRLPQPVRQSDQGDLREPVHLGAASPVSHLRGQSDPVHGRHSLGQVLLTQQAAASNTHHFAQWLRHEYSLSTHLL